MISRLAQPNPGGDPGWLKRKMQGRVAEAKCQVASYIFWPRDPPGGWAPPKEGDPRHLPPQAHLADEGGVGEGGPDVGVLVELVILGQLWGRQTERMR